MQTDLDVFPTDKLHEVKYCAVEKIVPVTVGQKDLKKRPKKSKFCYVTVVKVILERDACTHKSDGSNNQPRLSAT